MGDDTLGERQRQADREADDADLLLGPQALAGRDLEDLLGQRGGELDDRQIAAGMDAADRAEDAAAVAQLDRDLAVRRDHVAVGDQEVRRDQEAGAGAAAGEDLKDAQLLDRLG